MATFTKIGGGSTGGVTFPDGTVQTTAVTATYGGIAGSTGQVITSSTTFTVPAGITKLKVTCIGAGGGGAGAIDSSDGAGEGGSGGAGGCAIKFVTGLTPGSTVTVTIGTGGGGGGRGTGAAGGSTSFGTYCVAGGGGGGRYASGGGSGGAALTYDLARSGDGGVQGGGGGIQPFGFGYGTGGESGYGRGNESYQTVGKTGGAGLVYVEW
jgi:hypothetical protein